MKKNIQRRLNFTLFKGLMILVFGMVGKVSWGQNIFSGEPVQVVGQMNSYSTASGSNSSFRRVSVSSNQTDGRGQWVKTYNVQSSGGDFVPINMAGGGSNGFLFISGPASGGNCGGRYNNRWVFSGTGSGSVNSVNTISTYSGNCAGTDMGLNMNTAGRYTFVFNDVGYTVTNARYYVAYTSAAPVSVTRSSQTPNFDRTATIAITTGATPSSGEIVFVRYTTGSDFATGGSSSVVQATGSGTSWSATIPAQTIGSIVRYYVFTSTIALATLNGMSEIDKSISVINYDDNSNSNYTYTLTSSFTSTQTGSFTASSTWGANQPYDGASYTIANTHNVTLNTNATVSGLTINSGGTLTGADGSAKTLTVASGGTFSNSGTFTAQSGTVTFSGTGTISGTCAFNNVTLSGGVIFSSGSTVNGNLTINVGGFVNTTAPTYGSSSTLIYNSGTTYGRGTEWSATTGAGYPYNVQINSGTTLNLGANSGTGTARQCAGNLTINSGGTFSMNVNAMTVPATVLGKVTNNGTITLSASSGGDLVLHGDLDDNGTFTANTRAIFFGGSNTQTINSTTDPLDIDVMRVQKTGGEIVLAQNLLVDETADPFQVSTAASVINLNGKNLTIGKLGTTSAISMTSGSSIKCNTASSITIAGNGTLGTLRFDPSNNTLRNLTIDAGTSRTVTLGNALNIVGGTNFGVVTVGSGSTLNTGNFLTLKSDANGTASVGNSAGSVSGSVSVERFVSSAGRRWRFLSSPIATSSNLTIANWMSQFYVTGPGDGSSTSPANTLGAAMSSGWNCSQANITYPSSGSDYRRVQTTSIRTYNESASGNNTNLNSGWANLTGTNQSLIPGQGFRVFIRGPKGAGNGNTGQLDGTTTGQTELTLTLTGLVNQGSITLNSGSAFAITNITQGWNLIGNPYPCAYNIAAHYTGNSNSLGANCSTLVYIYNPTTGTAGYAGYNANGGAASGTGLSAGIIPSGGAFFIKANGGSPTFTFQEAYKITSTAPSGLHKTIVNDQFEIKYYKDTVESDFLTVKMYNGATLNYDAFDILKIRNDNLNLAAYGEDTMQVAATVIQPIVEETRIKLNVEATEIGTYNFEFKNMDNFDAGVSVTLLDKYTNKTTDVKANTLYTFEMGPNENQWGKNRFELILNGKATTGVNDNNGGSSSITSTNLSVYPNPATDVLNINISNANFKNSEVVVYNISGMEVLKTNMSANNTQLNIEQLSNGVYFVKVSNQNGFNKTVKFVK